MSAPQLTKFPPGARPGDPRSGANGCKVRYFDSCGIIHPPFGGVNEKRPGGMSIATLSGRRAFWPTRNATLAGGTNGGHADRKDALTTTEMSREGRWSMRRTLIALVVLGAAATASGQDVVYEGTWVTTNRKL